MSTRLTLKNTFITLIILLAFFAFISCESNEFSTLPGKKFTSQSEMMSFINQTDMTCLVFYYKKESEKSEEVAKTVKEVYSKLMYLAELISVDCDISKGLDECTNTNDIDDSSFYFLQIYVPPQLKYNPYTKEQNHHYKYKYESSDLSEKAIRNYIIKNIISKEKSISYENYENFRHNVEFNKVILFTNKPKTPYIFRGLSGYFSEKLLFGAVSSSEKKLCDKLGIDKFPTLMVIESLDKGVVMDDDNVVYYNGEQTAEKIKEFLEKYAVKRVEESEEGGEVNIEKNIYFRKLINANETKEFINKHLKDNVALYFDDKFVANIANNYTNLPEGVKKFNYESHGFVYFGWVNCENKEECRSEYKVNHFPSLQFFKGRYATGFNASETNTVDKKISGYLELNPNDYSDILREINNLFELNAKEATEMTFNQLLSESFTMKKIPLLYFFKTDVNLGFKLFTHYKKVRQLFYPIIFMNPPANIMNSFSFGGSEYPKIAFAILPNMEQMSGNNKENGQQVQLLGIRQKPTFINLKSSTEQTFRLQYNSDSEENSNEEDNTASKAKAQEVEIDFIQTTYDLVKVCNKKKLCLIGFFDQNYGNERKFNESFEIFSNLTKQIKNRQISYGYVNATCQAEFTSKFGVNIESLPSLIIYSYNKDVFVNLVGRFNLEDLLDFVSQTIKGQMNFQRIQRDNAKLEPLNCTSLQPPQSVDEGDDELMKELLEEERKKREEFDKMRGIDNEVKKKKKKKKKKSEDL